MSIIVRLFMICTFALSGYLIGSKYGLVYEGSIYGLLFGILVIGIEFAVKKIRLGRIFGGAIGLFFGIVLANLILFPLKTMLNNNDHLLLSFIMNALFGYAGLLIGFSKGESLTIAESLRLFRRQSIEENMKILDTSTIIDGRIADVCDTGFIEGVFIVPQFILRELQHIADSSDSMKRSRGRRGLDILHKIQKLSGITVKIVEEDFPNLKEVDTKLVALAKVMNAKIITNDFNLNKVAQLQDVSVLNINELTNALKPVVLPGETMKAFIMKEGKESNQGVAYMDDGTMVVVENARKSIGKNIDVTVTSVLQTTAGRMIFSKPSNEY